MEALSRRGFGVEALTGTILESSGDVSPEAWLIGRGVPFEVISGATLSVDARGVRADLPEHFRATIAGVPITLHRSPTSRPHVPDSLERAEILGLLNRTLDRFRPDVLLNFGGDLLAHEARSLARARGVAVVFSLHNFSYSSAEPFTTADAVIVPSRFAADHYRKSLNLDCVVLPNLVEVGRAWAPSRDPRYLTFVNPSQVKGVYPFVRIADELGRRRPDIPILVVESRGDEKLLVGCGIDLRPHGNVFLMSQTPDPRDFWRVTKVALMPSLWWENQPLVAVEAMINGIPVIGSDRGGIPKTLGDAGIVLPLPERLTPFTRELPTPEEIAPWVEAIIRLWDDAEWYAERSRLALEESRRWDPEVVEPQYVEFFRNVRPGGSPFVAARG
jgi:glycosyltransferase involved in cell wall biosynthesis